MSRKSDTSVLSMENVAIIWWTSSNDVTPTLSPIHERRTKKENREKG